MSLIDIRPAHQFETWHILGSNNFPCGKLTADELAEVCIFIDFLYCYYVLTKYGVCGILVSFVVFGGFLIRNKHLVLTNFPPVKIHSNFWFLLDLFIFDRSSI